MRTVNLYDGEILILRATTEKTAAGNFMVTMWDPYRELEQDRTICGRFETYSGALAEMYKLLFEELVFRNNLRVEE